MTKIFISHSSQDKTYVAELDKAIKSEIGDDVEIFASSLPKAIPSGRAWFEEVMKHLEEADILILLKTRNAENSIWVGFELGYFWKKKDKQNIFVLKHPKARLLSPIDTLQAKSIFDEGQLNSFFEELCKTCNKTYQPSVNLRTLVGYANDYIIDPMTERSLERFEYLIENAEWSENSFSDLESNWVCMEDVFFQIVGNIDEDLIHREFKEPWAEGFPDPSTSSYNVNLKIGGITVHQVTFVSLDAGRYFVPIPESLVTMKPNWSDVADVTYFWIKTSLRFKLGKLIGRFYFRGHTIYDFAKRTGIKILDETPQS